MDTTECNRPALNGFSIEMNNMSQALAVNLASSLEHDINTTPTDREWKLPYHGINQHGRKLV